MNARALKSEVDRFYIEWDKQQREGRMMLIEDLEEKGRKIMDVSFRTLSFGPISQPLTFVYRVACSRM